MNHVRVSFVHQRIPHQRVILFSEESTYISIHSCLSDVVWRVYHPVGQSPQNRAQVGIILRTEQIFCAVGEKSYWQARCIHLGQAVDILIEHVFRESLVEDTVAYTHNRHATEEDTYQETSFCVRAWQRYRVACADEEHVEGCGLNVDHLGPEHENSE